MKAKHRQEPFWNLKKNFFKFKGNIAEININMIRAIASKLDIQTGFVHEAKSQKETSSYKTG